MYSLPNTPKYCYPPYTDDYPFSPEWMYVNNSCAQYPAADVRPPASQQHDPSITVFCRSFSSDRQRFSFLRRLCMNENT